MSGANPERCVLQRQRTNKAGRAASQPRPKLANLGQMRRPVVDVLVEYGTQQPMLPDIRIKMPQQDRQSFPAADPIVKTWKFRVHIMPAITRSSITVLKLYRKYIISLLRPRFWRK